MGYTRSPVDSIREAVLTVSPKRQYRGIVRPTTPATHGPENSRNEPRRQNITTWTNLVVVSSPYQFLWYNLLS